MSLNADYQKLEPGNHVRLFSVDGTAFGMSDVLNFHAHNIAHTPEEIDAMKANCLRSLSGGRDRNIRPGRVRLKVSRPPLMVPVLSQN